MKTKFLIFGLLLTLGISCVEEDEYVTTYTIENTSSYTIAFNFFSKFNYESFILEPNEIKKYKNTPRGGFSSTFFPFEAVDSIKVTFNDNISVFHGSTLYNLKRNLLLKSSFKQVTDKATLREFEYVFTEEDYQEALTHQVRYYHLF
ncbi:MAG TPA: hypothetical protein DDZ39_11825 [Flavobacteriaceae bacterium]|nr:hypothetical protein [Flavobacteriaceae bacterium]